jgi:pimeloyl-ACP methyl ester carboxylesterase
VARALILRVLKWLGTLVVGLIVLVTLASVVFNAVTSDPNVPVQHLWHGRFVQADGVLTAYRTWGDHGTPVVLVGGFFEPTFVWDRVAPLLARNHRVYAFDLDGFGYTQRRGPWTLQEWGDQLQGFMRELNIRKPVVVGHSLGAAVAVEAGRRGLASRIVLLDGDALSSGGPPGWLRGVLFHLPYFTTALRLAQRWSWPVNKILDNAYGPGRHPDIPASLWTDQLRAEGERQALKGMAAHGIVGFDTLPPLHVPAKVVWGRFDNVDSAKAGRATAATLHAPFVTVPAGHLSMLVAPAAVARAIG